MWMPCLQGGKAHLHPVVMAVAADNQDVRMILNV